MAASSSVHVDISLLVMTCSNLKFWEFGRGLLLALQWSSLPVDVESDSLEAVKLNQSGDTNRSKYAFLIKEIKDSLIERNSCITHIVRSKNNASHFLASYGRSQCRTVVWLGSGPDELLGIASHDSNF